MNILEKRVQKTIAYLDSERGKTNWSLNIGRGYSEAANLIAAVQTATRLLKYESIIEVLDCIKTCKFCGCKTDLSPGGLPICANCQSKIRNGEYQGLKAA